MSIFTKVYPETGEFYPAYADMPASPKRDYTATPTIDETYIGATLCDRELNYYDDSDGYSHVWDGECVRRIGTWTTRAGTNHAGLKIDAYDSPLTDAIRQWHIDWLMGQSIKARSAQYDADAYMYRQPAKGLIVRVTKGRKVPIGTTGTVIWVGDGYARPYDKNPAKRIGIKDEAGNVHWTSASNATVIDPIIPDPDDYPTDDDFMTLFTSKDTRTLHSMYDQNTSSLAFLR